MVESLAWRLLAQIKVVLAGSRASVVPVRVLVGACGKAASEQDFCLGPMDECPHRFPPAHAGRHSTETKD